MSVDKQDELAGCIWTVVAAERFGAMSTSDICEHIAAAVRSFMGSDEVVERACTAGAAFCGKQWPLDFNGHEQEATRACTRTELSAAIGEPEGALRNPDAKP